MVFPFRQKSFLVYHPLKELLSIRFLLLCVYLRLLPTWSDDPRT